MASADLVLLSDDISIVSENPTLAVSVHRLSKAEATSVLLVTLLLLLLLHWHILELSHLIRVNDRCILPKITPSHDHLRHYGSTTIALGCRYYFSVPCTPNAELQLISRAWLCSSAATGPVGFANDR